ncbi:MAG: aminopeptidase P family protein [Lachnospiraceae bacterium]|nr:aminopeptidase P family protein [Lachnospiraceae bacterium]
MSSIYSERIESLRTLMKRDGVDYYIVFNSDSHMSEYIEDFYKFLQYLSGFTGSNATLLVGKEEAILWTDGRYFIQAKKELDGSGIELYKQQEKDVPTLREYLHKNAFNRIVATTGTLISRSDYEELVSELSAESNFRIDIDYAAKLWEDRPKKNNNKIRLLPKSIAGLDIEEKMSALREKMAKYKADAFFVSDLADIMWLFNIRGTDIEYSPLANAYAFVARQKAGLFIDEKAAPNELYAKANFYGGLIRPYSDIYTCLNFPEGCRILCDKRSMNARLYEDLTNLGNEMIDVPHDELIPKSIKNKTEIKNAQKYHVLDGAKVVRFIREIKSRVASGEKLDELTAAEYMDGLRAEIKGNRGPSFETICAYGENGAIVHYAPKKENAKKLRPKGFLLLDSGGQYDGATTDVTRTIALGELSEEMKLDYTTVLKGHLRLMGAVFLEGCRGENLDILARQPIWDRYLDYKHGTGHGVGSFLGVHEGPLAIRYQIRKETEQPALAPGMIVSDEPGIYLEGKYGIRIENLLLCVEKKKNQWGRFLGFEPLTLVPYEREAILAELLNEEEKAILNSYHKQVFEALSSKLTEEEAAWLKEACAPVLNGKKRDIGINLL